MWIAALASAAWVNRKDVVRWADFCAVPSRQRRPGRCRISITEAKVRAAVTSDPVLRRDPALNDLAVTTVWSRSSPAPRLARRGGSRSPAVEDQRHRRRQALNFADS